MVRLTKYRRQSDRGLVDQQNFRRQHQRAPERQHLLLTAAHRTGKLGAALGETGKRLIANVEVPGQFAARGAAERAEQQIFLNRELGKQPAALRHQRNAEVDDLFGGASDQIVIDAVDFGDDRTCARPHHPHDALHKRRLAVAVGSQQDNGLSRADLDRDVLDHAHRTVGGVNAGDGEATGQGRPFPLPDRAPPCRDRRRRSCARRPARRAAARSSSPRA